VEPARQTIEAYLFPGSIKVELVTKDAKLEVIDGHHLELEPHQRAVPWDQMGKLGFEPGSAPTFPAKDVMLRNRLVGGPPMRAYEVSGPGIEEELVAKLACRFSFDQHLLVREMEVYGNLRRLDLDPEVRAPKLKGRNPLALCPWRLPR
jgi:hypothetical protein